MKTLAKIFFMAGFLLASLLLSAQSKSDKIYDTFAGKTGITNFSFTLKELEKAGRDFSAD